MTQKVKNCPEWRGCLLTDYEIYPTLSLNTGLLLSNLCFRQFSGYIKKPVNIGKQSPNMSGKKIEIETLLDPFSLRMMFTHQQQPWSFCWCFRNHQLMYVVNKNSHSLQGNLAPSLVWISGFLKKSRGFTTHFRGVKSGLEPKPPHEKSWLAQSGERKGAGLRKRDPFFLGFIGLPSGKT